MHQIIINLVNNAIKFTSIGKIKVSVSLVKEDKENATIQFSLTDTGVDIPENKLKNIFGAFEQAHANSSLSYGGNGLGLAVVKQLVEHQGGVVTVKSKEGAGFTFSFILPFRKSVEELTTKKAKEVTLILKGVKILIAEDVKSNQLLIKILLENFGVTVDIADN